MDTLKTTGAPTIGGGAPDTAPRVMGLDLSITATGIAHPDGGTGTITTSPKQGDRRLLHIGNSITAHADPIPGHPVSIDLAVIEDLPTHAHGAGITGMVQGVARDILLRLGVPYALIPPATLKKYATGKGNATKADMRMALYQRAGLDLRDDNQVDAWWLRAMGLDALGHPLIDLPKTHRDALTKIAWPQAVAR